MKVVIKKFEVDLSDQINAKFYSPDEDTSAIGAERFDGKKRGALKDSDFLDPKRRSFPVVSCKNVKAAVSTWGMYKGSMSFETFKSKLTARAKSLGCESSLPKSWSDKADAKSKEAWEKTDKKELDRDTKKEKGEHEKDAVKNDKSKVDKLKKGKQTEKKQVEEHDLNKDEEFDEADKVKYNKAALPPWLKKKGDDDKDSDKKNGDKKKNGDDKKDGDKKKSAKEKFLEMIQQKKKAKEAKAESDKRRQEKMDDDEDYKDKKNLKDEDKSEKKKHYKGAVKQDKKEIKDLKKDEKEDKKDLKNE